MSLEARLAFVNSPNTRFADGFARADLLDPNVTSTWLVAGLQWMLDRCKHGILITAVNRDHKTYDGGASGNGHNGGKAADYWTASANDDDVLELVILTARNPYWYTAGLGGSAKRFKSYVTWPGYPFIYFDDNTSDHIHAQCQNMQGGPGARLAA